MIFISFSFSPKEKKKNISVLLLTAKKIRKIYPSPHSSPYFSRKRRRRRSRFSRLLLLPSGTRKSSKIPGECAVRFKKKHDPAGDAERDLLHQRQARSPFQPPPPPPIQVVFSEIFRIFFSLSLSSSPSEGEHNFDVRDGGERERESLAKEVSGFDNVKSICVLRCWLRIFGCGVSPDAPFFSVEKS